MKRDNGGGEEGSGGDARQCRCSGTSSPRDAIGKEVAAIRPMAVADLARGE